MKKKIGLFLILISLGLKTHWAQSASPSTSSNTEEISFDELVKELNSKVNSQSRVNMNSESKDPFESLRIHLSLGFIQTVSLLQIEDRSTNRLEDGIQLGLGIDLFSPQWIAEGILKNYGRSTQNDSHLSLREFDLRLNYLQSTPQNKMKFRLSNGLGARYLRYTDKLSGASQFQTTPVYLLGAGLVIPVGNHFDLSVEVQGHLTLVHETIDRHGLSVITRFDNFF